MRFSEEFRARPLVDAISSRLRSPSCPRVRVMEVCGTHTMSIARFGIRSLLPDGVELVSGPGCPVCVTAQEDIDAFIALGTLPRVILASVGDMMRVPGSSSSLDRLRAEGADVRVVYSPLDALEIAAGSPQSEVVFFGIGFETTMPAVALAIKSAADSLLDNFSVKCVHKLVPPALRALLSSEDLRLSGLLLPGHVTTIIGTESYDFIPAEFGIPCAIAGFEPVDIMLGMESILSQIEERAPRVDNVYGRAVGPRGNAHAKELFAEVFTPCDAVWRGLGVIPGSGIRISAEYASFDADVRFADVLRTLPPAKQTSCMCGQVLTGIISPTDCPLFGTECTPEDPMGPCMVSSEGACAAVSEYGGDC